jgi:uncharacterized membrane protein YhhN
MIRIPDHLHRALRNPEPIDRILWITSLAGGMLFLLYPLLPTTPPYPARVIIKALGVGMLAVITLRQARRLPPATGTLGLGLALALSCLGDIFLALRVDNGFIYGLIAFLIAHLVYLFLFVRKWRRPLRPPTSRLLVSVAVLAFSLIFSQWLAPGLGKIALPVMTYICAITLMVVAALWANLSTHWVAIGALLFMTSDSLLAADRFWQNIPGSGFLIWATYYLGQYGITIGYLSDESENKQN